MECRDSHKIELNLQRNNYVDVALYLLCAFCSAYWFTMNVNPQLTCILNRSKAYLGCAKPGSEWSSVERTGVEQQS